MDIKFAKNERTEILVLKVTNFYINSDVYIISVYFICADIHYKYLPISLALFWLSWHLFLPYQRVFMFKFSNYSEYIKRPLSEGAESQAKKETGCYEMLSE